MAVRIALIGMGRMGRAIDALAAERGLSVVARLDVADLATGLTRAHLQDADVAIEFTRPEAAVGNAVACVRAGCPVVVGTTGWTDHAAVMAAVTETGVPALVARNFSVGVHLFLALAEEAGRRLRQLPGFDTHLVETHHTAKLDAPSGTALAIGERVEAGLGHAVPITSVRVGSVPGTHELVIDGAFEQIQLVHTARDRRVFAEGALVAAQWLAAGRAPGIYGMDHVISV